MKKIQMIFQRHIESYLKINSETFSNNRWKNKKLRKMVRKREMVQKRLLWLHPNNKTSSIPFHSMKKKQWHFINSNKLITNNRWWLEAPQIKRKKGDHNQHPVKKGRRDLCSLRIMLEMD
jgi:hypothetical protein